MFYHTNSDTPYLIPTNLSMKIQNFFVWYRIASVCLLLLVFSSWTDHYYLHNLNLALETQTSSFVCFYCSIAISNWFLWRGEWFFIPSSVPWHILNFKLGNHMKQPYTKHFNILMVIDVIHIWGKWYNFLWKFHWRTKVYLWNERDLTIFKSIVVGEIKKPLKFFHEV